MTATWLSGAMEATWAPGVAWVAGGGGTPSPNSFWNKLRSSTAAAGAAGWTTWGAADGAGSPRPGGRGGGKGTPFSSRATSLPGGCGEALPEGAAGGRGTAGSSGKASRLGRGMLADGPASRLATDE